MQAMLLFACEALASLLPFVLVSALWAAGRRRDRPLPRSVWPAAAVLAVYAAGICYCTGAGTLYDLLRYGLDLQPSQLNLIPFSRTIDWVAYGLNVVLFLPFGFLAPLFCEDMAKGRRVLAGGFALSLLVELSQLLNNRSTDVDDLLLNTLGALAGWGLYRLWARVAPRCRTRLPLVLFWPSLLVPFAGRFLFFDEIGLAKRLYGF